MEDEQPEGTAEETKPVEEEQPTTDQGDGATKEPAADDTALDA